MKRKAAMILALILFLIGAGLLFYPKASNYVNNKRMAREIDDFKAEVERFAPEGDGSEKLQELYEKMKSYNEKIFEEGQKDLKDPFSYQQASFDLTQFGFDSNMIGSLDIPKMNLHTPIYLGASNENMAKGAAHLTQTSIPIGGINTNAVIAGHRGMRKMAMFRDINLLETGDDVIITNFREKLHYKVVETKIVRPTDVQEILIQPGRDMVTLTTCNPLGHNYQRYLVFCERSED